MSNDLQNSEPIENSVNDCICVPMSYIVQAKPLLNLLVNYKNYLYSLLFL